MQNYREGGNRDIVCLLVTSQMATMAKARPAKSKELQFHTGLECGWFPRCIKRGAEKAKDPDTALGCSKLSNHIKVMIKLKKKQKRHPKQLPK